MRVERRWEVALRARHRQVVCGDERVQHLPPILGAETAGDDRGLPPGVERIEYRRHLGGPADQDLGRTRPSGEAERAQRDAGPPRQVVPARERRGDTGEQLRLLAEQHRVTVRHAAAGTRANGLAQQRVQALAQRLSPSRQRERPGTAIEAPRRPVAERANEQDRGRREARRRVERMLELARDGEAQRGAVALGAEHPHPTDGVPHHRVTLSAGACAGPPRSAERPSRPGSPALACRR